MKKEQIAAQLFSIRNFIKTPEDIAASMKKIRRIGYTAVQVSGMGPIAEEELANILEGEGLTCCATHEPAQKLFEQTDAVIERLRKLNCTYTAVPSPGKYPVNTREAVGAYVKNIDSAGAKMRDAGRVLTYHNHNIEFQKVDGKTVLDIIYDETDPRNLKGEPDTHWIQAGGGNSVTWCKKLAGRLPLLHLKDYGINEQKEKLFEEIGYGNLEWKEIIAAAEESGCEWYIIEQDNHWENDDPFLSLKMSFDWLTENICG